MINLDCNDLNSIGKYLFLTKLVKQIAGACPDSDVIVGQDQKFPTLQYSVDTVRIMAETLPNFRTANDFMSYIGILEFAECMKHVALAAGRYGMHPAETYVTKMILTAEQVAFGNEADAA
ncbi:hypothetical protein [Methylorubrum extorquens]|uniref:hypothetical protein n=1 Tax=Methylorubrum extorquens TaxID=408 RepID=UPI001EE57B03|nr:hypothetical protein [Methylorubrum extorquens]MCG5247324.1 hypothetical protein [Methylorubrum extorquens]